jgi:hypothetical protein
MVDDLNKKKKEILDDLYYNKGKQQIDFEVCSLYKSKKGDTKSRWKWTSYSAIGFDIEKNKKKFKEINCRTIFPQEIIIDLEEKEAIDFILKKLDKNKFYYECYETGSRGFHIHLWFDSPIREEEKEKFILIFKGDVMKKSDRNVIALEECPHFKTGLIKTLFKEKKGTNKYTYLKDFLENYLPEEYEKILKNKNLFEKIIREIDKKIEGEIETREVIFLCCQGRLVKNYQIASYNLLVDDESGTGKDYVTRSVIEILPKDQHIIRTRISPTTFTYWHDSKNEPDWTWDGKVFYCEDISEEVLNSEVFKVMCSAGSSATVTIRQQAVDIEVEGKPVMISTTASASPNPELVRRFIILNLDESEKQTRAIMRRKSDEAKQGIIKEYDKKLIEAQRFLKKIKVKIPYADKIDQHFPEKNIIVRTNYPRFLDFVKASVALHQYQRKKKKGFYLAEKQDYDIAKKCFLRICSNKYMLSLTKNQKDILSYFEKNPDEKINANALHLKGVINLTLKSLIYNLDKLVGYGLLESTLGEDSYGREMSFYSLSRFYSKDAKIKLPEFNELK